MLYRQTKDKIQEPSDLMERVEHWRQNGEQIVFTNGCFDLLHKGHVDYLIRAKDLGDRLVVALNTDASVSKLKGPHRPIQNEDSRLWIMAALQCVDAVCLFDEETPINIIKALLPEVLVKGGDYTIDTVVGATEVTANGGRVELLSFLPGFSTSSIEAKIKQG